MESFLRQWRQDAFNNHQYESAIFIGDKLLALTSMVTLLKQHRAMLISTDDDSDTFWLAQLHFSIGNYTRSQSFLTPALVANNPACKYLSAHCSIRQGKFDEALALLGDKNPVHLISAPGSTRRKLQHVDTRIANGRGGKALGRTDRIDRSEEREREDVSIIKHEAAMCYLRGLCYAKQNAFDRAKECYKDAVRINVLCFEAFDQLMKNSLMSPDEEWEFLSSLNFDSIVAPSGGASDSQEAAHFTKMLYTTRLSKYSHPEEFTTATETLSTHYRLSNNPDILLSKAELLFTQCRFRSSLSLTSAILARDKYNFNALPIHLACLHELGEKNTLFLLSHDLADTHPHEPCSWLAVGVYYLSINRIADARRYFSKASIMDPHFGPAWIGFAHTFAAEGEHDQAISAYSTAARLFQGTHLPQLFLGMQNLMLNNISLAQEYLNSAYNLCKTDPLLLNELGVVFYHSNHIDSAIAIFSDALNIASTIDNSGGLDQSEPKAWISTRANLAHALRRAGRLEESLQQFNEVLRSGGKDANVFCAKGLVLLELGRAWEAVVALHEALAVSPQDPVATELLSKALAATEDLPVVEKEEEDDFERRIEESKKSVMNGRSRRGRKKQQDISLLLEEEESMVVDDD